MWSRVDSESQKLRFKQLEHEGSLILHRQFSSAETIWLLHSNPHLSPCYDFNYPRRTSFKIFFSCSFCSSVCLLHTKVVSPKLNLPLDLSDMGGPHQKPQAHASISLRFIKAYKSPNHAKVVKGLPRSSKKEVWGGDTQRKGHV